MNHNTPNNIYSFLVLSNITRDINKTPNFYYSIFFTEETPTYNIDVIKSRLEDIYIKDLVVFHLCPNHKKDYEKAIKLKTNRGSSMTIHAVKPITFFSISIHA